MDPGYAAMRSQRGPHPLLDIPCTEEELRGGPAAESMIPEASQGLVDASLYMESNQLHEGAFHAPHLFNPESPYHQLLPNSPAPGNGALLPAEYFDSLLNAYGVELDPRQMADARMPRNNNPTAFLQDGGLDVLAAETPGRGDAGGFQGFGPPGSNSPMDMYSALHRFAASFANGGGLGMPVQTPRQLAAEEPSPYGAPLQQSSEMEVPYTTGGSQFPEGSQAKAPPEQGFNSRVLTSAACITAMIQKLRSPEDGVKREAMQAIRMWSGSSLLHQRAVAAAGAIAPLVDVLSTPSSTVVWVEAAQTLASLAINNEENKAAIGVAGAIPPLVNLLGLPSREAREAAVGGLSCLARNEHNKQAIMDAGAVTGLVRMLTDGDNNSEFGREAASNVLAKLAVENDANKKAIGHYGAIPYLIRMVERGSAKEREVAAGALANLIQDPQNALELVGAGGVEALSDLLDCPWEGARQAASAALTQVSVHEAKWNEEFNLLQAQGLEDGLQPVDDEETAMGDDIEAAEEILRNAINENGGEEEGPLEGPVIEEDQPDDVSISESESSEEDLPLLQRRPGLTSSQGAKRQQQDVPLAMRFRIPSEEALAKKRGAKRGRKPGGAATKGSLEEAGSEESSEEDVPLGMRRKVMSEEDLPILAKGLKPPVLDESVSLGVGLGKRRKLGGSRDLSSSEPEQPQKRKRKRTVSETRASEERASGDEELALRELHSPELQTTMTELLGMDDPPEGAFEDALTRGGHVAQEEAPLKESSSSEPAGWDVVTAPDEEADSPKKAQKSPGGKKRKRGGKKRSKPMQPPLKVSADVLRKAESLKPPPKLSVPEFSAEKEDAEATQCECIGATAGVHNGDCRFRSPVGKLNSAAQLLGGEVKSEAAKPKAPLAAGLSRLIVAFAAGLNASPDPSPPEQPTKEIGRKPRGKIQPARPKLPALNVPGLKQGLPALMGMLRSASLESQEFGCLTVALLAVQGGDAAKKNMVEGGVIPALITIVRSAEAGRVSQLLRGGAFFPLIGRGAAISGQSSAAGGGGMLTQNGKQRKRRNAFTNVGADGYSRPPPPDSSSPALAGPDLLPPTNNAAPKLMTSVFCGPDLPPPHSQQSLGPPSAAAAAARHIGLDLLPPGTSVTQFGTTGVRYRLPMAAMMNRRKVEGVKGAKLLKPKSEPAVREAGVGTGGFVDAVRPSLGPRRRAFVPGKQNFQRSTGETQDTGSVQTTGAASQSGKRQPVATASPQQSVKIEPATHANTETQSGAEIKQAFVDLVSPSGKRDESEAAGKGTEEIAKLAQPSMEASNGQEPSVDAETSVDPMASCPEKDPVAAGELRSEEETTIPREDEAAEAIECTENETQEQPFEEVERPPDQLEAANEQPSVAEPESNEGQSSEVPNIAEARQAALVTPDVEQPKLESISVEAETSVLAATATEATIEPETTGGRPETVVSYKTEADATQAESDIDQTAPEASKASDEEEPAITNDAAPNSTAAVDALQLLVPSDSDYSKAMTAESRELSQPAKPLLTTSQSTNAFSQALVGAPEEPNPKPLAALARIAAANALSTLCVNNSAGKDAVVRCGGVQALAIMAALAQPTNPQNPERSAALSALGSLSLSDAPQKQRTSVLAAVPWLAKMMEGADPMEVAAGAGGLQSVASSLSPEAASTALVASDPDPTVEKHIPVELVLTLMELIAGGIPEARSAAIQALASFLVVRPELSLEGFKGLGGAQAFLQLRQAGRAGARALLSLLADPKLRKTALVAVAGSRRLLGWLEEEGVAPALIKIFRGGREESLQASALAAAFNVGATKGKLTGIGGEDIRALVGFLKETEKLEAKQQGEVQVVKAEKVTPDELQNDTSRVEAGALVSTEHEPERVGVGCSSENAETEGRTAHAKEQGGTIEASEDSKKEELPQETVAEGTEVGEAPKSSSENADVSVQSHEKGCEASADEPKPAAEEPSSAANASQELVSAEADVKHTSEAAETAVAPVSQKEEKQAKPLNPSALYDHAAGVLVYAALGCDANGHAALVSSGGIPCIVRMLATRDGRRNPAREAAAAALMMLAASSEQSSRAIRGFGGVTPLVEILAAPLAQGGGKVWSEKEAAAAALVVLAGRCEEGRKLLISAGGVRALVSALQCSDSYVPPQGAQGAPGGLSPTGNAAVAQLLSTLAVHHPEARSEMTSLGVIRPLVNLLVGSGRAPEEGTIAQEAAAAALANIVQGDEKSARAVADAGAIAPLVRALAADARGGAQNLGGQLAAMTALASLVRTLPQCQKEMVRAGAVGGLMALVTPPGQMRQMKETAALVLTELATDDRELQETVGGSGAIAVLVGMLNGPGKGKLAAARALTILTSRCEANKHRARNAGADVSILSTLKMPGLSEAREESDAEKGAKAAEPPARMPPGARAPLAQVRGGVPRATNGPPGKVALVGRGQNQAPWNVRAHMGAPSHFPPGVYPGHVPGGPRPIVHHIRAPQPRTPQYYRPSYKAVPQRPVIFPPAVIHQPRAPVQQPRAFVPGPKLANGKAEMGTQAQCIPLVDRPGTKHDVSRTLPEQTGASNAPDLKESQTSKPQPPPALESHPIEKGTAEMGCQARPLSERPLQETERALLPPKSQGHMVSSGENASEAPTHSAPVSRQAPKEKIISAVEATSQEINPPPPIARSNEGLPESAPQSEAFPVEARKATSADVGAGSDVGLSSAARRNSDLSLQMLAEVTAAAEAERERERGEKKGEEAKRASTSGTKRSAGEAGHVPQEAEGNGLSREDLPRPPKKPRTGMLRTPSKAVCGRFPALKEDSQDAGQREGSQETAEGADTQSENGRRMKLRGVTRRST